MSRLQRRERAIRLGFGQVAHALLFDEVAGGACEQLEDALDDPVEQRVELCHAGSARFMEQRRACAAAIHAIEHQAMQMNVESAPCGSPPRKDPRLQIALTLFGVLMAVYIYRIPSRDRPARSG